MRRGKLLRGLDIDSGLRGRPSQIPDGRLEDNRNRLRWLFESFWGLIGWELQTCKSSESLRRTFVLLQGVHDDPSFALFTRPSARHFSPVALKKMRTAQKQLNRIQNAANEPARHAEEVLQRARTVLETGRRRRERKLIRREFVRRKKLADGWARLFKELRDLGKKITGRVLDLENAYALQELLRFLKSKRYALNPLNLANAAAGLPYIGWRQSMRLCLGIARVSVEGIRYQVFKSIRYMVTRAPRKDETNLIRYLRDNIPLLPPRFKLAKTDLAQNWFYLNRAIHEVCRSKHHPRCLPFLITACYLRQAQVQSHLEIFLAEQNKLHI